MRDKPRDEPKQPSTNTYTITGSCRNADGEHQIINTIAPGATDKEAAMVIYKELKDKGAEHILLNAQLVR